MASAAMASPFPETPPMKAFNRVYKEKKMANGCSRAKHGRVKNVDSFYFCDPGKHRKGERQPIWSMTRKENSQHLSKEENQPWLLCSV